MTSEERKTYHIHVWAGYKGVISQYVTKMANASLSGVTNMINRTLDIKQKIDKVNNEILGCLKTEAEIAK